MKRSAVRLATVVVLLVGTAAAPVSAGESVAFERIIAVKAHLAESQAVLREYGWIETTVFSSEGEERSRTQYRCSYSADGQIRKVPVKQPSEQPKLFDRRFKQQEVKNENLTGLMQEAVHLVNQYIPLNLNGLTSVTDDGKLSFNITDPGKQGRLTIRDFLKRGDRVELDLDLTNSRPLSLNINSFYETRGDSVTLTVIFGSLYGGATFVREAVLKDKAKEYTVTLQNTDYTKPGN